MHVAARWRQQKLPTKKIYFGKSCMGKTTYLEGAYPDETPFNVDVQMWEYFADTQSQDFSESLRSTLKNAFEKVDAKSFKEVIRRLILEKKIINWYQFFNTHEIIDFAAFGAYFEHINYNLVAQYQLIKFENTRARREECRQARGIDIKRLNKLDALYQDPPFWDHTSIPGDYYKEEKEIQDGSSKTE